MKTIFLILVIVIMVILKSLISIEVTVVMMIAGQYNYLLSSTLYNSVNVMKRINVLK